MHICPAEIAAALFMLEQAAVMYWYLKMQIQGFSGRLRARFSPSKSVT